MIRTGIRVSDLRPGELAERYANETGRLADGPRGRGRRRDDGSVYRPARTDQPWSAANVDPWTTEVPDPTRR